MANRYIPIFLKHSPTPRVENFALLAGLEAAVRAMLISVMPLTVYDALRDAGAVSRVYFIVGAVSLMWGLMVPWATRHIPRRWVYTVGALLYVLAMVLAVIGGPVAVPLALMCSAAATATTFVCFNAYVLDYISRAQLGRSQSMNMLYAATPWAIGPVLGVWLRGLWAPLPFLIAAVFALVLLSTFWVLRLGNGKQITRARGPAVNPLSFLGRFFAQPRLIAGWTFAVIRSCGWWVYVVYLPIFCIEAGLGDKVAGMALSASNALLFTTPLMLRVVHRKSVRRAVRAAFAFCASAFVLAALLAPFPWVVVAAMMTGSAGLVLLDVAGGLPFLMAVKPSERTDMAAVYSSFRDVSGILTPGFAWVVLLVAPLPGVFALCGAAMGAAWLVAGRMHPRLGAARPSHGVRMAGE
ncbi:MAG: MFS transporter [Paracoccaceae bacterium]|nr:MFS transporter [Paracoccaceae bacterium]